MDKRVILRNQKILYLNNNKCKSVEDSNTWPAAMSLISSLIKNTAIPKATLGILKTPLNKEENNL